MYMTLGQAAKATGKSKGTITNSIERGRISASKDDFGRYKIDPVELTRIYPLAPVKEEPKDQPSTSENVEDRIKIIQLQAEVKKLEELLLERTRGRDKAEEEAERSRSEAEKIRQEAAEWRRSITALLPSPAAVTKATEALLSVQEAAGAGQGGKESVVEKEKGWLRRMFG